MDLVSNSYLYSLSYWLKVCTKLSTIHNHFWIVPNPWQKITFHELAPRPKKVWIKTMFGLSISGFRLEIFGQLAVGFISYQCTLCKIQTSTWIFYRSEKISMKKSKTYLVFLTIIPKYQHHLILIIITNKLSQILFRMKKVEHYTSLHCGITKEEGCKNLFQLGRDLWIYQDIQLLIYIFELSQETFIL